MTAGLSLTLSPTADREWKNKDEHNWRSKTMIVTTLLKFAAAKLISGFMFLQMCQPGLPPVYTSGGSNAAPPKAGWRFKDNAQQWTSASTIKVVLCDVGPAANNCFNGG